jgi:hypothetical protein
VGLAIVLPLLLPGFVLAYDMVFVPRPDLSSELLGISRNLPRAVPSGLVVALASRVLTGQVVQKIVLLAIFGGAAYGAARLVPARYAAARIAAGLLYAWNPFTYERLLLGQWNLLLGYAVLPWVAAAALSIRRREPGGVWRLTLALAAAMAPILYTGVLGAVLAAAVVLWPPWRGERAPAGAPNGPTTRGEGAVTGRTALAVLGIGVVVNLPWLVPALTHPGIPDRPELGVELFGARADSPLGTVGSLLSLGGLWRTDLAPPGRSSLVWLPAFVLIAGLAIAGWRRLGHRWPRGSRDGLLVLSALGLVLAAAPALPGLRSAVEWLAGALPGGAALRDSQKFVIPLALAEAVGFGVGVDHLLRRAQPGRARRWVAALIPLLPLALAPTLAWGAEARLSPVPYPSSWGDAAAVMEADPAPGAVLVLPWHTYLPLSWNEGRTVHEPASTYFDRPVVASSSLRVGRNELPHEDPWSLLADPLVEGATPITAGLPELGVRYVLLLKEADWQAFEPRVKWTPVLDTSDLTLYRGPRPGPAPAFDTPPAWAVLAADAAALSLVVVAAARRWGPSRWPSRKEADILRPSRRSAEEELA